MELKSKVFLLEYLNGLDTEVFILRDGKGVVIYSTTSSNDLLDFLKKEEDLTPENLDEQRESNNKENN